MTKMEILNAGEMAYYKPYISNKKDKDTFRLFLQRAKSKAVKTISTFSNNLPDIPLEMRRSLKIELVYGYPYGLDSVHIRGNSIDDLFRQCDSNRLPRPSICWVADLKSICDMRVNVSEQQKLGYLLRNWFDNQRAGLRVMVDPSFCTKEALLYYVDNNETLFNDGMGAMLTLGSLMGDRAVSLKDLEPFNGSDILVKVNGNIKSDKEFDLWMQNGADYIGTPFLDRVLDGY